MMRVLLVSAATLFFSGPALAQADINCTIEKTFRCTAQGCQAVSLPVALRFNLGSKQGCLVKNGKCDGNLPVESSERVDGDVIVRFKGNGMVLRINVEAGNMVGADAYKDNQVIAYGGSCRA